MKKVLLAVGTMMISALPAEAQWIEYHRSWRPGSQTYFIEQLNIDNMRRVGDWVYVTARETRADQPDRFEDNHHYVIDCKQRRFTWNLESYRTTGWTNWNRKDGIWWASYYRRTGVLGKSAEFRTDKDEIKMMAEAAKRNSVKHTARWEAVCGKKIDSWF